MRLCALLSLVVLCLGLFSSACASTPGTSVVIITGFEPFDSYDINPSQLIAEALNGSVIQGVTVIGMVLPVNFSHSFEITVDAIQQHQPVLVISLGLNARSGAIQSEKIAINLKQYPKDDGTWSFPRRIQHNSPMFRITSLRTFEITREIRAQNISSQRSFFAGTYVCNSLFYQLLGYVKENDLETKIGFIHVPLLDVQHPEGMPLQTMIDAVTIAIQTSLKQTMVLQ